MTNFTEEIEQRAREGKKVYEVTFTQVHTYKVWADSSDGAKAEVQWMKSSQRPYPTVESRLYVEEYDTKDWSPDDV